MSLTYSFLLIVDELLFLILELDVGLPPLEILGLLDAISARYLTLRELTEGPDSWLQRVKLLTECFDVVLDLCGEHILGDRRVRVVAYFQDSFGFFHGSRNDGVVENMEELFISNRSDLSLV